MDAKKGRGQHTTTQDIFARLSQSKEDDIDRYNQSVVIAYRELLDFLQGLETHKWPANLVFFEGVEKLFSTALSLVNSFTDLLLHYVGSVLQLSQRSIIAAIHTIRNTSLEMAFEQYHTKNLAHQFQDPVAVSQDMHAVYSALNQLTEQLNELVIPPTTNSLELTRRLNKTCEILFNYMVLLKRIQQKIENYHFDYRRQQEHS